MTVAELSKQEGFKILSMPLPERETDGIYIGDLLSWVMGRARENNVWLTIMSNINVVAVASLADTACVILCEGVTLDEETVAAALEKNINILMSDLPVYETALKISELI